MGGAVQRKVCRATHRRRGSLQAPSPHERADPVTLLHPMRLTVQRGLKQSDFAGSARRYLHWLTLNQRVRGSSPPGLTSLMRQRCDSALRLVSGQADRDESSFRCFVVSCTCSSGGAADSRFLFTVVERMTR